MIQKVSLILCCLVVEINFSNAQNIAVNTTGTVPAALNLFEVTQTNNTSNSVGIFSSNTGTGTNAYAIWAQATGATNKYAIVVPAGGGSVGIGTTEPQNTLHVLSDIPNTTTNPHPYRTGVMVEGELNTFGGRIAIRQAGTNPCLTLYRNNGTISAPTTLISGDMIGNLAFGGYDGSSVIASPGITAEAAETWGASSHGWHIAFNTVNTGSSGSTEKMRLLANGTLKMTGTNITSPGIWMDGTVTSAAGTAYGILSRGNLTVGANNEGFFPFSNYLGNVNTGTYSGLTFYGAHFDGGSWTKTGTGTISNGYGIYVTAPTIATNNYAGIFTGGNVGIGTITPLAALHVVSTSTNFVDRMSNAANEGASFMYRKARGTVAAPAAIQNGDEIAKFLVSAYDGSSYVWLGGMSAVVNGVVASGSIPADLVFGVSSTHMGNPTSNEAMRITNTKYVGIGTTSPSTPLHVDLSAGAGNEVRIDKDVDWVGVGFTQLRLSGKTSPTHMLRIGYSTTGDFAVLQSQVAGAGIFNPIALNPNGGNVGIGTISPLAKLHVAAASTGRQLSVGAWSWADISSNQAGRGIFGGNMYTDHTPAAYKYSDTHGSIGAMAFAVNYPSWNQASVITSGTTSSTAGTAFTPTMIATFDYSGKVGIGTITPATKLDVQGTSGATLKIVDGNQGAGKVLTSDASGVASWSNSAYASGSGNMVMLYNDETSSAGLNTTTASIKSFTIPATYTKVKVEVEVEDDANTSGNWTFNIVYNGATVRSVPMGIIAGGAKNVISFSYTGAIASGQIVRIDANQTSGKNVFVRNFRVYGIY